MPGPFHSEPELANPLLRAPKWYARICVPRVYKHSIFLYEFSVERPQVPAEIGRTPDVLHAFARHANVDVERFSDTFLC